MLITHHIHRLITLEPNNDFDTIYKVLKKAGEMSAAAEKQATTPMKDIPIVNINVPDYPDREPRTSSGATSRGPFKPNQSAKQGLSAPMADISSSGRVLVIILQIYELFLPFLFLFASLILPLLPSHALEHNPH